MFCGRWWSKVKPFCRLVSTLFFNSEHVPLLIFIYNNNVEYSTVQYSTVQYSTVQPQKWSVCLQPRSRQSLLWSGVRPPCSHTLQQYRDDDNDNDDDDDNTDDDDDDDDSDDDNDSDD